MMIRLLPSLAETFSPRIMLADSLAGSDEETDG